MFSKITNPVNNKEYSIYSKVGRQLVANYIDTYQYHQQNGGAVVAPVAPVNPVAPVVPSGNKDCMKRNAEGESGCNGDEWRSFFNNNKENPQQQQSQPQQQNQNQTEEPKKTTFWDKVSGIFTPKPEAKKESMQSTENVTKNAEITTKIDKVEKENTDLKNKLIEVENENKNLQSKLNEIEEKIKSLQNQKPSPLPPIAEPVKKETETTQPQIAKPVVSMQPPIVKPEENKSPVPKPEPTLEPKLEATKPELKPEVKPEESKTEAVKEGGSANFRFWGGYQKLVDELQRKNNIYQ